VLVLLLQLLVVLSILSDHVSYIDATDIVIIYLQEIANTKVEQLSFFLLLFYNINLTFLIIVYL